MGKMKTEDDYLKEVIDYHNQLLTYPDNQSLKNRLDYRVKRWMEFLDIRIEVANNEQNAWSSDMIGYPTCGMRTKKDTGVAQVGDYSGVVKTLDGDWYVPMICERKSVQDAYGTLVVDDNRKRFYREIARFKSDDRFDRMITIVEGSLTDFLLYQPEFDGGKFDYKRRFDKGKNDIINDKKLTVLADLHVAGVCVMFCDNAILSAQMFGRMVRESIRKQYWRLLKLEKIT